MMFIVCSRFVQVTCEKLEEPKKGLIWNAVHKLGLEALQDLLREVCNSRGGVCCLHSYQTDVASDHPCIPPSLNAGVWEGVRDENGYGIWLFVAETRGVTEHLSVPH